MGHRQGFDQSERTKQIFAIKLIVHTICCFYSTKSVLEYLHAQNLGANQNLCFPLFSRVYVACVFSRMSSRHPVHRRVGTVQMHFESLAHNSSFRNCFLYLKIPLPWVWEPLDKTWDTIIRRVFNDKWTSDDDMACLDSLRFSCVTSHWLLKSRKIDN